MYLSQLRISESAFNMVWCKILSSCKGLKNSKVMLEVCLYFEKQKTEKWLYTTTVMTPCDIFCELNQLKKISIAYDNALMTLKIENIVKTRENAG